MSEEPPQESTQGASGRRLAGYLQASAIVIALLVVIYFAQAPVSVPGTDLGVGSAPKPVVSVIEPVATDHAQSVNLTGQVGLSGSVTVTAQTSGRVAWIAPEYKAGSTIAAGQTIIRIDPANAQISVERAKARGEHETALFMREHPDLEVSERAQRLPTIAVEEAKVRLARSTVRRAELQLKRTSISFPFEARVLETKVEIGTGAGPGRPLGKIYRPNALQVTVPIQVADLARLGPMPGRDAEVRANGRRYSARVERVSSAVAPKSRMATAFLTFADDGTAGELPLPGTFAEVTIRGTEVAGVYVLPDAAEQGRGRVWVADKGVLKAVSPRTLERSSAGWVVAAFDAADGIVTGAVNGAREGLAIELADDRARQ